MKRILLSIAFLLLLSVPSNGQNLFSPAHLIFDEIEGSTVVLAASLDGDKYWDVLSCSYTTKQLFWYKNNGDGTFSDFHIIDEDIANILDFEAVDFDGDGDKDILAISESQDLVFWYANDGEGQFGTRTVISTEADSPRAVTVADVDGDGDLDALSASHWDGKIAWYQNDGNGNFGEQQVIHTEAFSSSDVAAADLDGDGDIDVVGTSYNDGRVVWSENLGGGNFAEAILISTQFDSPRDISVDDFDLDGDTDILIYSYWDKTLVLFKNDGIGNFDNHTIISQGISRIHEIYTGDLDKDGDTDILFSASGSRIIAWFENDGSGQFGDFKIIQDQINSATGVFAADLDRDGDKDVLVSNANGIGLSWYENLLQPNQLTAFAFHDQNENGLFDSFEKPLPNFEFILNPGDYETYSNVDGYTHFFTEYGTYDLTFEPNTLWELTSNQENYVIQYDVNESLPVHQFGFKPTQILSRTEPYLSSSPTRCNRESTYWLNYSNTGTTTTNGTVTLEIDELMTFVSSHPEPDLIEGQNLLWNFSELYAGHENKIKLQFKTPGTNSIGEILESQATIQLFNDNEELIYSKTTDYNSEVRCSYDPNDKLTRSNLLGQSEFAYIEDTIHYTIRFQNTGNDTAFNIRIEDVLDKKLDWTTFHPITSSHDFRTDFNRETGVVNFYFDDILLPDSTTNQEGSNGFVTFGIASLPNIGDKTEVGNTAYIFFDFNPPIITNTAILTLIQQVETDVEVLDTRYDIAVYPNPFSDFTTIEINGLPNGNYELELTDIFGRKVSELKMESGKMVLQRGDLESGLYFFRILKSSSRNFGKENELVGSGKILVE